MIYISEINIKSYAPPQNSSSGQKFFSRISSYLLCLFLDATNGILQCCSSSNTSLSSIQSDLRKGQRRPSQRPKKVLIENAVYNEPTAAAEEITSNSPVRKLTTNNLR